MPSVAVLVLAALSVAAPPELRVAGAAIVRPPARLPVVRFQLEPDRTVRPRPIRDLQPRTSNDGATRVARKRGMAPVVGGMLLGAIAGFFAGNYVQHSVCEYDCGPGGFTWGFTAAGAAGGAAIGWLFR
jgi:hypothetical protein